MQGTSGSMKTDKTQSLCPWNSNCSVIERGKQQAIKSNNKIKGHRNKGGAVKAEKGTIAERRESCQSWKEGTRSFQGKEENASKGVQEFQSEKEEENQGRVRPWQAVSVLRYPKYRPPTLLPSVICLILSCPGQRFHCFVLFLANGVLSPFRFIKGCVLLCLPSPLS